MNLDWTIPVGTFLIIGVGLVTNLAGTAFFLVRTAFALQHDFDTRFAEVRLLITTSIASITRESDGNKADIAQVKQQFSMEYAILREKLSKIEAGQDSWTKILRARTHALSNEINKLIMHIHLIKNGRGSEIGTLEPVDIPIDGVGLDDKD